MKYEKGKREMLSRRACSESGAHPDNVVVGGINQNIAGTSDNGGGGVSGMYGHLWGKRSRGPTSAPVLGNAVRAPQPIILRTRRSWPVAPLHCRR